MNSHNCFKPVGGKKRSSTGLTSIYPKYLPTYLKIEIKMNVVNVCRFVHYFVKLSSSTDVAFQFKPRIRFAQSNDVSHMIDAVKH